MTATSHLCPSIDATTTWASAATAALTAPSAAARSTVGLGLQNRWSTARPFGRRTTTRLMVGTDLIRPDALAAPRNADANARERPATACVAGERSYVYRLNPSSR